MGRFLSWLANAGLLVLCCFFAASTANTVFAAWLAPAPEELAPAAVPEPRAARTWGDREVILRRNLFNASIVAPAAPPPPVEEELEETKLPLELIGTVASPNPDFSWAAVQDKESRQHLILQVGDDVKGKAVVERIEAKRIVLQENGSLRELALAESPEPPPLIQKASASGGFGSKRQRAARARAQAKAAAARRTAAPAPEPAAPENPLRNAAQLFSQAQILPRFEEGAMVGVQINAIQEGSIFAEIGLEDGDLITELNGVRITSPEQSAKLMAEFAEGAPVVLTVEGENGPETLELKPGADEP